MTYETVSRELTPAELDHAAGGDVKDIPILKKCDNGPPRSAVEIGGVSATFTLDKPGKTR